jgi:hypothetical protein
MEEKKNLTTVENPQQLMKHEASADRLPSESLKQVLLGLDLLVEDFEKSDSFVNQIEHFISAPLAFDVLQRKVIHLIESLKTVTERSVENYQYLADVLEDIYRQTIELENAIGETHESLNARFTFWLHTFQSGNRSEGKTSREIPNFSEFLDLLAARHGRYAYFLAPFESKPLLICRYIPLDSSAANFAADALQFSTYVAPPTGSFRVLKRAWDKLFKSPNKSVLHLFHHSRSRSLLGTFKRRSSVLMTPYRPYQHSELDQLPKIVYDFINIYGISGCCHVHLLKRDDQCAVFATQRHVQFDGRSVQLSDADCPGESPKDRHRLIIE